MFKVLVMSLTLVTAAPGFAFQLDEHDLVMRQAVSEFKACFPQFAALNVESLVAGDLDEDINLFTKELFFSHFYNPYRKLRMWRQDSLGRLANLKPNLQQCHRDMASATHSDLFDLGHALHHLQDMAVPPHVVPVNHSFWDGFENFKIGGDISSGLSCAELAASGEDMEVILDDTAKATLAAVRDWKVEVLLGDGHQVSQVAGSDFWRNGVGSSFGAYGVLGNNFGHTQIEVGGETLTVNRVVYDQFKRMQVKLAVRATLRGLGSVFLVTRSEINFNRSDR